MVLHKLPCVKGTLCSVSEMEIVLVWDANLQLWVYQSYRWYVRREQYRWFEAFGQMQFFAGVAFR
jgi:hypothetical protein